MNGWRFLVRDPEQLTPLLLIGFVVQIGEFVVSLKIKVFFHLVKIIIIQFRTFVPIIVKFVFNEVKDL